MVTAQNSWGPLGFNFGGCDLGCGWVRQCCWTDFRVSFCRWWLLLSTEPPFVPPAPPRSSASSSPGAFRGVGVSPVPSYRGATQGSHGSGELRSPEQWGGIHSEHSVWGKNRAQRVQPSPTPLPALLMWDDILITRGQSWEICVKPQIWTYLDYYSSKKLNFVLFSCSISHFHIGNTYLLGFPSIVPQLQGISLKISGIHSILALSVSNSHSTDAVTVLEKHRSLRKWPFRFWFFLL